MKKWKIITAALAMLALPVFAWVGVANAQRFSATVAEGEVVDSSLYSTGQDIDINGTINGDIYCAGQTVRINATVNGDVICAGQSVTVKGQINGNIRVAGQTVSVDAQVERSLTVAAQSFSLDSTAVIKSDATLTGGTLNVKGSVERDVVASGSDVFLKGAVGRNVEAGVGMLTVEPGAVIGGNLNYTSEKDAYLPNGIEIAGEVTKHTPQQSNNDMLWGISTGVYLYTLAAFLLIGLIVVLFFPQAVRRTGEAAHKHFGKTLLTGFLASIIVPILIFVLALTFVGMPLALILAVMWALFVIFAIPMAGYFYAKLLFRKVKNTVALMIIGSLIVVTLLFVPFVGLGVFLVSMWIGAGAMLVAIKKGMPKAEYRA
jgi:cytoskeletal protein CcmA (bactofilin family)